MRARSFGHVRHPSESREPLCGNAGSAAGTALAANEDQPPPSPQRNNRTIIGLARDIAPRYGPVGERAHHPSASDRLIDLEPAGHSYQRDSKFWFDFMDPASEVRREPTDRDDKI